MFSPLVRAQWIPDAARPAASDRVAVAVDPTLAERRSVSLLHPERGPSLLSLSPARSDQLDLADGEDVEPGELRTRLQGHGITLNDPDVLFFLPLEEQAALRAEGPDPRTRELTAADAPLFEEFTRAAPEDELDEAFVELDHWLVVGTVVEGRLESASSMYPWGETRFADLGVITLPEQRGQGLGRATVRGISAAALDRGYEPQYRCQVENTSSIALAESAGFRRLGTWEIIDAERSRPIA